MPLLISMVKEHCNFPQETLSSIDSIYNEVEPLWQKVQILRNKCVGHISNESDLSVYYKRASVGPNDVKRLLELARLCLNEIQYSFKKSRVADLGFEQSDIESMMKDLKAYHELRGSI